ncbi:MAG: hypothetical protein JO138_00295 [Acidobacteriaceae bacterium]|nr:hypothetical protein [Acidobacteriaceae bacterium]
MASPSTENALETQRDLYAARRFLYQHAPTSNSREMLSRWARLEDWYGSEAPEAYSRLLDTLLREKAPKEEIMEICHRGLLVCLREERFDVARRFAGELADLGDSSGLKLIPSNHSIGGDRVEIPGGVAALHFLVLGKGKPNVDRFLLDYSRVLSSMSVNPDDNALRTLARTIHEYFQQVSQLAALGSRKAGHIEIVLTLNDEEGKQRTETALNILGLRLTGNEAGIGVQLAEGKSEAKRQETQAALAINDRAIQQALSAGKPYFLEIPLDSVPVYPAEHVWQLASVEGQHYAGGLTEFFLDNPALPRLYLGLNSMDHDAAEILLKAVPFQNLVAIYSQPLSLFSDSLALNNNRAEVPGGPTADLAWQQLVGASPSNPAAFFLLLLTRDEGRLVAFFDALSHLDLRRQRFFTRSPGRTKCYYELFRDSPEVRQQGGVQRLQSSTLVDLLREIPLSDSGAVVFPGSPQVWMVAKGGSKWTTSGIKLDHDLKRPTAPPNDDAVLIRLATTDYKTGVLEGSELSNFIAVSRVDRGRAERLTQDSALLLAQSFPKFGALFPYFSALGDLTASDFQNLFMLAAKLEGLDFVTANIRLGEFHSYLAMRCLVGQSGSQSREELQQLYRQGIKEYLQARDAAAWTGASLAAIDDLTKLVSPNPASGRDAAIRALLTGSIPANSLALGERLTGYQADRNKAYRQVLSLQRMPSIDALFAICDSLGQLSANPGAFDRIRERISTFLTIAPPSTWRLEVQKKEGLKRYQTANLENTLSKLSQQIARAKGNPAEIEQLSRKFLAELEPWVELAMAGQIYARYLDPSDLVVSSDPLLLRKHVFAASGMLPANERSAAPADFRASSFGEGSHFSGGFAQFSLAAGQARAEGNHLGAPRGSAVAGTLFASVRATDWHPLTESGLQTFGANVRLAREWIVESTLSEPMRQQLEEQSMGLLSFVRRKALLAGIVSHDWTAVWEPASVSDLYFLGRSLHQAPAGLWKTSALLTMKQVATQPDALDLLGPVAPDLSGCALPRLQDYQAYEEYGLYSMRQPIAQRVAELKLYLAWLADSSAWQPANLPAAASLSADTVSRKLIMRDMWDWSAVLDAFRSLSPQTLGSLQNRQ